MGGSPGAVGAPLGGAELFGVLAGVSLAGALDSGAAGALDSGAAGAGVASAVVDGEARWRPAGSRPSSTAAPRR